MNNRYPNLEQILCAQPGATHDYKPEWGWDRYLVGGKMFAATCLPDMKHGIYGGHPLLSIKCDPLRAQALQEQFEDIHPGFYMDKTHWISIFLDGSVPDDIVYDLCSSAYQLVFSKLTRRLQSQILSQS